MKKGIFIGIDPDVDKSGFAVINNGLITAVASLSFSDTIAALQRLTANGQPTPTIVVEASWATTHNWHSTKNDTKAIAAKKGYSVGRNHQVGICLCEIARNLGAKVVEHAPLRKSWKGTNGKITHSEIAEMIQGSPKRTNQEERDALLLVATYVNYPLRLKVK